jgi:hypothetical protein
MRVLGCYRGPPLRNTWIAYVLLLRRSSGAELDSSYERIGQGEISPTRVPYSHDIRETSQAAETWLGEII